MSESRLLPCASAVVRGLDIDTDSSNSWQLVRNAVTEGRTKYWGNLV